MSGKDLYQILAETQAEHFPEYISQSCLCGVTVENAAVWADHVAQVVTASYGGDES